MPWLLVLLLALVLLCLGLAGFLVWQLRQWQSEGLWPKGKQDPDCPQARTPETQAPAQALPARPMSPVPAPAQVPPAASDEGSTAWPAQEAQALVYTLSHDLKAPLRVVEGFSKILQEDYGPRLDKVGLDHLERILGASRRMHLMMDALLAMSRLSTQALQWQAVDLTAMALQILDELQHQHPQRQVFTHVENGLIAQGDATLLRMVLENLLGNAWKYSSRQNQAHIRMERHTQKPHTFTVSDNGAGFDMRFASRLFSPFQRLHSTSEFPGHGVGLASVQRIVVRHGGEIWAQASPGQGASFHFSLPPRT